MKRSEMASRVYLCDTCGAVRATGKYSVLDDRRYDPKCEGFIRSLSEQQSDAMLSLTESGRATLNQEGEYTAHDGEKI